MNYELAAVASTIAFVASRAIYRHRLKNGADPIVLLLFSQIGGGVLASLYALPALISSVYSTQTIFLLFSAGIFWTCSIVLEVYALRRLYLVQSGILNSLAYVLMLFISAFIFNESFSILGATLVLIGVSVGNFRTSDRPSVGAVLLQFGHAIFNLGALSIDKELTKSLSPEVVGAFGFIAPAIFLLTTNFQKLSNVYAEVRNSKGYLLGIPVLNLACYVFLLTAFQGGNFSVSMSICETSNLVSLIFGIIFLRELHNLRRNTAAAALTSIGAIILVLWK